MDVGKDYSLRKPTDASVNLIGRTEWRKTIKDKLTLRAADSLHKNSSCSMAFSCLFCAAPVSPSHKRAEVQPVLHSEWTQGPVAVSCVKVREEELLVEPLTPNARYY